jgi:N6-adenosine-specific RNA methylase IME4
MHDLTTFHLPDDLSKAGWREMGIRLGKLDRTLTWAIGDWWLFGHRYGDRKAIVSAKDWQGVSFASCMNAARVCKRFPTSRRREVLSFEHHAVVASLPPNQADALLDWCEETIPTFYKPRSTAMLRAKVRAVKRPQIGLIPSGATCNVDDLYDLVASGKKFGCIYMDPPLEFEDKNAFDYGTMSIEEVCALPVRDLLADDGHLHIWVPNALIFEAFPKFFDAFGVKFKSKFTWVKPPHPPGPGAYWRNSDEVLWTAVRGNATRFNDHSMPSWGEFPRREHSRKPDEVRDMVRRASPGPYLELFARLPAEGWTTWGNQIDRSVFLEAPLRERSTRLVSLRKDVVWMQVSHHGVEGGLLPPF